MMSLVTFFWDYRAVHPNPSTPPPTLWACYTFLDLIVHFFGMDAVPPRLGNSDHWMLYLLTKNVQIVYKSLFFKKSIFYTIFFNIFDFLKVLFITFNPSIIFFQNPSLCGAKVYEWLCFPASMWCWTALKV